MKADYKYNWLGIQRKGRKTNARKKQWAQEGQNKEENDKLQDKMNEKRMVVERQMGVGNKTTFIPESVAYINWKAKKNGKLWQHKNTDDEGHKYR